MYSSLRMAEGKGPQSEDYSALSTNPNPNPNIGPHMEQPSSSVPTSLDNINSGSAGKTSSHVIERRPDPPHSVPPPQGMRLPEGISHPNMMPPHMRPHGMHSFDASPHMNGHMMGGAPPHPHMMGPHGPHRGSMMDGGMMMNPHMMPPPQTGHMGSGMYDRGHNAPSRGGRWSGRGQGGCYGDRNIGMYGDGRSNSGGGGGDDSSYKKSRFS